VNSKIIKNMFFEFLHLYLFNVNKINVFSKEKNGLNSNCTTLHINVKKINTDIREKNFYLIFNGIFTNNNNSPPE
jgi:hypothetical protein